MRLMRDLMNRRQSEGPIAMSSNNRNALQDLEEISIVSSNATPSQVIYGSGPQAANGPRVVPGTITTGGRIGERRSISGTRLNMGSPGGYMPGGGTSFKASMESLKPTDKGLSSVSKQSLLDMRFLSRESLATGYGMNRTVTNSELDINRSYKSTPRRRSQDRKIATRVKPQSSGNNLNSAPSAASMDYSEKCSKKSDSKSRGSFGIRWTFVFDPAGRISYYWHMVVSLAFLYNLWVIIFRFAFAEINRDTLLFWFCFDYLSDFVYVLDILISFRIGYQDDGVLQTDTVKLRNHYMNSTNFYVDCLCLLPLDFLYLSIGFNSVLRLFRLVKVYRFWMFMDRTERHTNYPNLFRALNLLHYLLVTFHWNGCLYHIIYKNNNFGSRNWVYSDVESNDILKQYLQSYYWCTLALTTIGDLPKPRSNFEYGFVIMQLLFGLLLFATVLGHVASIVVSVSASKKEFQAKLDGVKTYMRMRRVPAHLQTKVIRWFDYLWLTQKCSDEEKAISCLPDKLKAEIAINVHLDTLKRVEIFQNTEAGFLCELVLKLRPVLFSPGDYICRKGEVGKEMYIVSRGRLQVVADDGKTVLATLRAGSYFGEISILNMGTAGNRRTASVRSVGYSDLFVLSKKDMWDVLKEYPAARVRLEAIATKRLEKYRTDPDPLDVQGLFGRRCKSTPGIIESHEKVSLEDMWISPFTDNLTHRNIRLEPHFHQVPSSTPIPSPSYRVNKPSTLGSPLSIRSSGHSSEQEQTHAYSDRNRLAIPQTLPTISQTVSDNDANDLNEVVVLKAEITRLQEQLKDVEKQNKFLNEKLTQQQWDMDHRLAEIEMQICRDTSSVGSSIDENERNRESVI
ncbi:cyclic nucleotide-gated cation channel alpha-3 isoform X2 [Planococcus citri]|uniref:cyclic nucleotide-gated cation channel alpha-3 isoform X2 n=1 Tax=Planococcus citri TaxID=170843 RepID=UPI0031F92A6D